MRAGDNARFGIEDVSLALVVGGQQN